MIRKLLVTIALVVLIQGCATPFSRFYHDTTGGKGVAGLPIVAMPTGEPTVYRGNNLKQDAINMMENGYSLIGYSSFNAGNVNENGAIEQAKKVHASTVIIYSKYTGSETGVAPMVLPYSRFYSTVLYVPYTVQRSEYFVSYWIKLKPLRLGVHTRELSPEVEKRIGSNKGAMVTSVVKGSPAFDADILIGDVIKK